MQSKRVPDQPPGCLYAFNTEVDTSTKIRIILSILSIFSPALLKISPGSTRHFLTFGKKEVSERLVVISRCVVQIVEKLLSSGPTCYHSL